MAKLALYGGKPELAEPLPPFNTIGNEEALAAMKMVGLGLLSGYLAGQPEGGDTVQALERTWCETFKVKHAIAVNSATSGLLAAGAAVGLELGDWFYTTPYTMSATVAAPMLLGARPIFGDVEDRTFCLAPRLPDIAHRPIKAVFVTNLFGHPAALHQWRTLARNAGAFLIEDNAQAPFAMEDGQYTGTIGNIGVFSLNVHKFFQSGEGGVCVTNDDYLADRMRSFCNHGEVNGNSIGLNLRMTEVTAAIAIAQLNKADAIMKGRLDLAERLTSMVQGIPSIRPPVVRDGCKAVHYIWPILIEGDRDLFVDAMCAEGVPMCKGYVAPLYRLPAFSQRSWDCPVVEDLHDRRLAYFENCAYSPTDEHLSRIENAFHKVAKQVLA